MSVPRRLLLTGLAIFFVCFVLPAVFLAWALGVLGIPSPMQPAAARFSERLSSVSSHIAATRALEMEDLREICIIPEYASVNMFFSPRAFELKSGARLKPDARFTQGVIWAHTGLLAVGRGRQVYFQIDLMHENAARLPNVDFECFDGRDAVFWRKEAGWWSLEGTQFHY